MPRFQTGLTDEDVTSGQMPPQPRIFREISSGITLTTTFQRLNLATLTANTFPLVDGSERLVDWDATGKYLTFNSGVTQNYIAALNGKVTMSGITVPPLAAPIFVQFRFVVPDGVSPGVDYYFPFSTGDGYMDLQMVSHNSSMRHQQLTPITSDAIKRATGVGCEARISANPLTGTCTLPYFSVYMFGA